MPSQKHLLRRGDTFYYRAKVPFDIVEQLKQREVWISLRTTDRRCAERRLAEVYVCQLRYYEQVRNGDIDAVCESPSFAPARKDLKSLRTHTIDEVMGYWVGQSNKRPRTLLDGKTVINRLKAVVGKDLASAVTKLEAVAFKDALIAEGLAYATIVKNIRLISSMFELAHGNGLVYANPFASIKLAKAARIEKPRLSFSQDDLQLIFQSPVFLQRQRPLGGAGDAAVWLPVLALLTGMRLEEIGQLRKSDIKSRDGIWYIDLDYIPEEGRWLKNDSSRRQIPVHSLLIELGFLKKVEASQGQLFPILRSAGNRQRTSSWSQWFGRYLRSEIGITDRRKTFHSFRHTFKDLCREASIPKEVHDRLTGHKSSDVGDGYGSARYPLQPLALAIQRIEVSLPLSANQLL